MVQCNDCRGTGWLDEAEPCFHGKGPKKKRVKKSRANSNNDSISNSTNSSSTYPNYVVVKYKEDGEISEVSRREARRLFLRGEATIIHGLK